MSLIPSNVTTIVFDLGGVIINLEPLRSVDALMKLAVDVHYSFEELVKMHGEHFHKHERGQITDEAFRSGLRSILNNPELSDGEIDEAWNQMLLDIPIERIDLIKRLRKSYKLIVLSNTNQIHVDSFTDSLNMGHGIKDLEEIFDVVYYSHRMNYRKPESGIFTKLSSEQGLNPSEIFFIDDNKDNIDAANSLGWNTQLLEANTLNTELY